MTVDPEVRSVLSGAAVSDEDALERMRSGDRAAFAAIYDRHVRTVYRYALHLGARARDAEDVTQDVFVLAFEKARSITLIGGSVLPWLLVACRNVTLARRRKDIRDLRRLTELDAEAVADEEATDAVAERRAIGAAIDAAIAQLPDVDRRVFILCTQMGRSYQDAAAELGLTHASVRNRLARLRVRLQATLSDHREVGS